MAFEPMAHPIILTRPELLLPRSAWCGHIPFAFLLLELLRPRTFIELGTMDGVSYCAFCQGVRLLGLDTRCTAVDTWAGDPHAGYYGPEVLATLKSHHDPRYASFSRLLQTDFDSAVHNFADGSIDLLHIDGLHTYEAVRHDFETYFPKLSDRAVVIFHDSAVRLTDYGVYRLIAELAPRYRHFEFLHSYGLAVLLVGPVVPAPFVEFVNDANASPEVHRKLFAQLGEAFELHMTIHRLMTLQFHQMQLVNTFKNRNGRAVDPKTQRMDAALSEPLSFALNTLNEISAIFRRFDPDK